jgi:hypothetical protein
LPQPTSLLLSQHDDFNSFFCEAFKHDGYYHLVRAGYGDSSTAKITNCDRMHSGFSPFLTAISPTELPGDRLKWGNYFVIGTMNLSQQKY